MSLAVHNHIYDVRSTMITFDIAFGISQGHRKVIGSNNSNIVNLDIEMSLYECTGGEGFKDSPAYHSP